MIKVLSTSQTNILMALARYKFLTTSQLLKLGISNRKSNLSVMLKALKESKRPLIGEMNFAFVPSKGRLENFYYLKRKGYNLLVDSGMMEATEINVPKGNLVLFTQDYFHRKYTIDCHIACDLETRKREISVDFFHRYFDKTGNNRTARNLQAKTKIDLEGDYIIADGAFLLSKGEASRLFAFELYNDNNTKRICQQLEKHLVGIKNSALCRNYGLEKGHRVLAVFTQKAVLDNTLSRIESNPLAKYVLCNTLDSVQQNFFNGWMDLNREQGSIV